jgi:hypothetical protein
MDAGTLHAAIAEVCPVISTAVGIEDDRTTWSFEPDANATQEQIDAGINVLDTIPVDYKPPPQVRPDQQVIYDHENRIRAIEGAPPLTLQDFLTKAKLAP